MSGRDCERLRQQHKCAARCPHAQSGHDPQELQWCHRVCRDKGREAVISKLRWIFQASGGNRPMTDVFQALIRHEQQVNECGLIKEERE